jgi:hypothetical protein
MTPAKSSKEKRMGESKAKRIASVKSAGDYTLHIRWVNGESRTIDLQEPVHRFKGMHPLRDKAVFAQVSKGGGGHCVVWPGGIDMGADRLWKTTLEQNGHVDTTVATARSKRLAPR